jgi:hypothetical protein
MKKFSLTQLETARKNPLSFGKLLTNESTQKNFSRKSKYADWKNAIYKYHKTNNLNDSLDYFEAMYNKHFESKYKKNIDDFELYSRAIHTYVIEHNKRNFVCVESRKNVLIELVKEKLSLSGQVPIINLNDDLGYSIFFFSKESTGWETELRFPIIQDYFATNVYGVEVSEIEVGIYSIGVGKHFQQTFSLKEIKSARTELVTIGNMIATSL